VYLVLRRPGREQFWKFVPGTSAHLFGSVCQKEIFRNTLHTMRKTWWEGKVHIR